ncbi:hypothetical protein V5O48_016986, partial [Marasmius crinis-equi]
CVENEQGRCNILEHGRILWEDWKKSQMDIRELNSKVGLQRVIRDDVDERRKKYKNEVALLQAEVGKSTARIKELEDEILYLEKVVDDYNKLRNVLGGTLSNLKHPSLEIVDALRSLASVKH